MSSVIELIKLFYIEGFFSEWKTLADVKIELEKRGFNFSTPLISMSLMNSTKRGVLFRKKISGMNKYSQRQPPEVQIKEEETTELNKVFSEVTKKKLGERFQQDIRELNVAFISDCGNSAAFLLRKILEKTIFHVLASNGKVDLTKNKDGTFMGLDSMINLCSREKLKGSPILLPKTAKELLGMKFLGDSSAHNYLADIELKDINHQLSYWTIAVKELIVNLK